MIYDSFMSYNLEISSVNFASTWFDFILKLYMISVVALMIKSFTIQHLNSHPILLHTNYLVFYNLSISKLRFRIFIVERSIGPVAQLI